MTTGKTMQQSSDSGWFHSARWDIVFMLLLAIAVFLLFRTSPHAGDFWWSDAPRHAMDGVFYHDLARALPITHMKRWAMDYYLQYPAITVLYYPPLFAVVESVFFTLFGVSHATAQLTVTAFLLAAACGAYFLTRQWVGRVAAFATALLFLGAPSVAFWGRQVMLEIPTFAFLIWSCYFFFRYLDTGKPRDLYLVLAFVLAAIYTKQTVVFVVAAYLLTLCFVYRRALFRRREFWRATVLFVLGMVPVTVVLLLWGRLNLKTVTGGNWVEYSRLSLAGWLYVARQWPYQVGWIVLTLGIVYCAGALVWKRWRLPSPILFLMGAWVLTGYVFFTLIALKLERHTIFLIFALVFFAVLAIVRGLPAKIAPLVAVVLAVGVFAHTLLREHVPYVSGYRAAAQYVCSIAPPESVVLFSGLRDGSFIFNVKSTPECKNLAVIRADKLLLRVPEDRHLFGVTELGVTEGSFKDMLGRYSVRYVVSEPNFWNDLESMRMLVQVLHEDQFKLLTTIPVTGDREPTESRVEIYENLGPISREKNLLRVELPAYGITVEGKVGKEK
jgi:4-amino-4-deoxy-L-arabinose transferase-like glycosyltransferase